MGTTFQQNSSAQIFISVALRVASQPPLEHLPQGKCLGSTNQDPNDSESVGPDPKSYRYKTVRRVQVFVFHVCPPSQYKT